MNSDDNGVFTFNEAHPPLFVKPPLSQENAFLYMSDHMFTNYLKEASSVCFHHDAMLDSGLTAGEAGWLFQRDISRRRTEVCDIEIDRIIEIVKFHISMEWTDMLRKEFFSLLSEQPLAPCYKRNITNILKEFLVKKGYDLRKIKVQVKAALNAIQVYLDSS